MRKTFTRIACVIAAVVGSSGAAQAQTVAAGPYYATPSWDQTLACTAAAACPRFIVLSNMNAQAVLDRETGLVWLRETVDVGGGVGYDWNLANQNCLRGSGGTGRRGWRLPTFVELSSLLVSTTAATGLPAGHPFVLPDPQYQLYWTSTEDVQNPGSGRMMAVFMANGGSAASLKSEVRGAWCVRGG